MTRRRYYSAPSSAIVPGLYGQPTVDRGTGVQVRMFPDVAEPSPPPRESAVDAKIRRQYAPGVAITPELFGFQVLDAADVVVSRQGVERSQSIMGRLTKCLRIAGGVVFYVREALDQRQSFTTSSGLRMRMKTDSVPQRLQVLELATDADASTWAQLANLVNRADGLHRPVVGSRRFTPAVAERELHKVRSRSRF
jgi:hypothetical protein